MVFDALCLTLSIIRYGSRVKWSNPRKGVVPSPSPWCSSYRKGSLRVTLDYGRQLYLLFYQLKFTVKTEARISSWVVVSKRNRTSVSLSFSWPTDPNVALLVTLRIRWPPPPKREIPYAWHKTVSDDNSQVLGIWGIWYALFLSLFPLQLFLGMEVPVRSV